MKVVALVSGGKDSCYNMMQCVAEGHQIVALANLRPIDKDELDSYMYQTVGHHAIELYAGAMGLPLFREDITGTSISQGKDYHPSQEDEVEDLYRLLRRVKGAVNIDAVSVGAILSNYQRVRVEHVCARLGLTSLGYLWRRDQEELLSEMICSGVEAIIIKVAALGLNSSHLCKTLAEIQPHMIDMKKKYQLNPCGEGGEYETFTLDCPLFNKRIVIDEYEVIKHDSDPFAPVCFINFKKMHLEDKKMDSSVSFEERLEGLPMKRGSSLLKELGNPQNHQPSLQISTGHNVTVPTLVAGSECCNMPEVRLRSCTTGFSWVSGIIASRNQGSLSESINIALNSLKDILASNNLPLSSVVMVHVNCQDLSEFSAINAVMKAFFPINPPIRVTVQVSHDRDVIFSMDCMLYQPSVDQTPPLTYEVMHVQGISHWAPANIGPYSQAIRVGDFVYCAGMVPLCPSTMKLVEGGIHVECVLSLRSVGRVLSAMSNSLTLRNIVSVVCFVTDIAHIPVVKEDICTAMESELVIDTEFDNEEAFTPIVCYIVVPRLPRDVLVELHVIASLSKNQMQYKQRSSICDDLKFDSKHCWDPRSSQGIGLINVAILGDVQSLRAESVFEGIVKAVEHTLQETSSSWESVLSLRLYYCHTMIRFKDISKVFRSSIPCSNLPAISCIPVEAMELGNIMSICINLSSHPERGPNT